MNLFCIYWQMLFMFFIVKHWSMILSLLCIDDSVSHYSQVVMRRP